jgi:hypothetical protein
LLVELSFALKKPATFDKKNLRKLKHLRKSLIAELTNPFDPLVLTFCERLG